MSQKRAEETRERVLDAATELALEHGFASVSIKNVQQRSGVSNGSIFHHFGSKDGIIRELFVAERRRYLGQVARAIVDHEGDPLEAFGAGSRAALRYHCEYPDRYRRLFVEFTDSDWMRENEALWRDLAASLERPVVEWAIPHVEAGRIPTLPPSVLQSLILGPPELISRQWLVGRLPGKPTDYAEMVANFVTSGLRGELERSKRNAN